MILTSAERHFIQSWEEQKSGPKWKFYLLFSTAWSVISFLIIFFLTKLFTNLLETWRKGAEVTMVVKGNEISSRVKYWVKPDIENRIKEGSVKAFFNAEIKEIREKEVDILTAEGMVTIENDWVLAMTGYQPNLNFLRSLGIEIDDANHCTPNYNEENFETNVPGIYLAGVICGGMNTHLLFIENSREHAQKIMHDISLKMRSGRFLPRPERFPDRS